jgi:N-acetyl-1-D-myo-inositol-2-amino-2-deoxy-alpha-D-glucopyranoside deacetylase
VLLAVHAHPDDEAIGTGGTLARYAREGARTVLVTCTGGEVGEISDPALASLENLGEVRARELQEAVRVMGVHRLVQLGYRDSGMAGTSDNGHPASFSQANLDEAIERVVRVVREERPQVIITYDENGGYGHPDHVRAHQVAVSAFGAAGDPSRYPQAGPAWQPSKLYYVAFSRSLRERFGQALLEAGLESPFSAPGPDGEPRGLLDEMVTTEIDISEYLDVKRAAMLAHRTQIAPGHFFVALPLEKMRQVWDHEYFQRVEGPHGAEPGQREKDLFSAL